MAAMVLWTLLLCAISCTPTLANERMPRFNYSPNHKVMLFWSDFWEAGSSNVLSILTEGKTINIKVSVSGNYGGRLKSILSYECPPPSEGKLQNVDLSSLTDSYSEDRCSDTIPFALKSTNIDGNYELRMGTSRLPYAEAAKKNVKLTVRVDWNGGAIYSNPLFLYNLDPLTTYNAGFMASFQRKFLTTDAIELMTTMNYSSQVPFPSVRFIESSITDVIKAAPQFARSKITMGSTLYFDAGSCLHNQLGKATLFISYYSKFDLRHQNLQKLMHLDIESGYLDFCACGLKREIFSFFGEKRPQTTIGICTIVSLSGESEPYFKIQPVDQRFPVDKVKYQDCTVSQPVCEVAPHASPNVTIISGMDTTALVCPVLCNYKNQPYQFFRGDTELYASKTEEWTHIDGIRIPKSSNIIEFTPAVSEAHSGEYRCSAGLKSFKFNVHVISMPHFAFVAPLSRESSSPSDISGLLPERVFAVEGEALSYSCTVRFSGLNSVTVTPIFYMPLVSGSRTEWVSLTDREFRQKILATDNWMNLTTSASAASKALSIDIAHVPPVNPSLGTNFSHRFVCNASVSATESKLVGMSDYRIQTGADVFFIQRLTKDNFIIDPNNNCSVQMCGVQNGASFKFALSVPTIESLRRIGVDISAYLMLDDLLLADVKALSADGASEVQFDAETATLSYRIKPISSQAVLNELQMRKNLTAVFKLQYKKDFAMNNLKLDKSAYGSPSVALGSMDCRSDPLCFYSTNFDLTSSLSFLRVDLAFIVAPLPPDEVASSMGTILGVAIAAAVALLVGGVAIYFMTRSPERSYLVEEKEIRVGHNPKAEAKDEAFKDYVRAGAGDGDDAMGQSVAGKNKILNSSIVYVNSSDDLELS